MHIQESLGYLIAACGKLAKREIEHKMRNYGVTGAQWAVLQALQEKEGSTQSELATFLHSDKATIGAITFKLEQKGCIKRCASKKDGRAQRLFLTPYAQTIRGDCEKAAVETNEKMIGVLSEKEMAAMGSSLRKIRQVLEGEK